MKQVDSINTKELQGMADSMYGNLVKAVVDLKERLLVVDVELHVDAEQFLLENGSKQQNLWGINLYPENFGTDKFVEFDSLINIRPSQNNMSRNIEDETIRKEILTLIKEKITND
jgi:hypothetical protein